MKSAVLVALLSVVGLAIAAGFTGQNKNMSLPNVRLNIKDATEYGLRIIGPSDPSYDNLVSKLLPGRPTPELQALLPYSVILKNASKRTVIACRVKWEFTEPSGRVRVRPSGFITFGPLMGLELSKADPNTESNIIKPEGIWLFTPSAIDVRHMNRDGTVGGDNAVRMQADYLQRLTAELSHYTNITVSLDGLFFDDGSFVGPDTTNFFAYVEGLQKARHDIFSEVERGNKQGKITRESLDRINETAKAPKVRLSSASTPADYYNFEKRLAAQELLRMREKGGDEVAISFSVEQLKKPWLKLQKK